MTFVGAVFGVLAGALLAAVVGYVIVRLFATGLGRPELFAWSFATGLLVQAALFLVVVSILPGRALVPVIALDAAIVVGSFVARRPRSLQPEPSPRVPEEGWGDGRRLVRVLLAIAGAAWLLFLVSALSEPMWSTDYLAVWGLKAKIIATTGHVPTRLFSDPALYWGHPEYPLLVSLSLAVLSLFSGWHDQALALFFPLCELATLAALYGFLARRVTLLSGAAAAALTAVCFPLYQSVNSGTAEIPFAFSLVLVSTAFLDALSDRSRAVLARLAVASLVCVSIKQEGTLFVLLVGAALLIRRRREGWAPLAAATMHALLLHLGRGPQTPRAFDFTFFEPFRWGELVSRLTKVLGHVLTADVIHSWLPLLAVVLLFAFTRHGLADPLLPLVLLQVLAYVVSFSMSAFDPIWAAGVLPRLTMSLFPNFTLVLCARLEQRRQESIRDERSRVESAVVV
jgi:hypothetical protein